MTAATSTRVSGLPENHYAPDFLVEVEGKAIDPVLKANILEVTVVLDSDDLSSVDLKLNNYDDTTFDLMTWLDSDLFRLGNRVHVQLGYADRLVSMLRGPITTLSPAFASDGASTLTVRVMDPLVALKGSYPPRDEVMYSEKRDWEIAQRIAERHHLKFAQDDDKDAPIHELVVQGAKDDLTFIKERAAMNDREVFTRTNPDPAKDVLHFGKRTDGRDAEPIRTYVLTWGSLHSTDGSENPPSMIEFMPTIAASDQVQSVTVLGWDSATKEPIDCTAEAATTPGVSGSGEATGPAAAGLVAGTAGKRETVDNAPVANREEAKRLAESLLASRARKFLTATGRTIGVPDLRPGDNVEIHGVGTRFGGTYYVTKATHVLDASGLLTEFAACKTYQGARK